MKKKMIAASLPGIAILAVILICFPLIKLWVISHHYGVYGSYVVLPEQKNAPDTRPVDLTTESAEYHHRGLNLTNVVYYPGLRQLAFGYIYNEEEYEKYGIMMVDQQGQQVAGVLWVSGSDTFYSKKLQKLNYNLEEPLEPETTYTLIIADPKGERLGTLNFVYDSP